jgi:hypothetical protein
MARRGHDRPLQAQARPAKSSSSHGIPDDPRRDDGQQGHCFTRTWPAKALATQAMNRSGHGQARNGHLRTCPAHVKARPGLVHPTHVQSTQCPHGQPTSCPEQAMGRPKHVHATPRSDKAMTSLRPTQDISSTGNGQPRPSLARPVLQPMPCSAQAMARPA